MLEKIVIAVIAAFGGFCIKLLTLRPDNKKTKREADAILLAEWERLFNQQKKETEDVKKEMQALNNRVDTLEKSNAEYKRIISLAYGCAYKAGCPIVMEVSKCEK